MTKVGMRVKLLKKIGSVTDQEKYVSFFRRDESLCFAVGSPVSSKKRTCLILNQ